METSPDCPLGCGLWNDCPHRFDDLQKEVGFLNFARELISRAEGDTTIDQAYIDYTKSQEGTTPDV